MQNNAGASIPAGATVKDKYKLGHGQLSADKRAVWFTQFFGFLMNRSDKREIAYPLSGKGAGNTCSDLQPIDVFGMPYTSRVPPQTDVFPAQNSVEVVISRWNGPGVPTTDVIAWAGEPYGSESAIGKWLVVKPNGMRVGQNFRQKLMTCPSRADCRFLPRTLGDMHRTLKSTAMGR